MCEQSPSIRWPEDRAWFVATEIDSFRSPDTRRPLR